MDEAQDLIGRGNLPLLDLTIHGGLGGGRWSMFGDFTRQSLYNRDRGNGSRDPVADLKSYGRQGLEVGSQGGLQFVKAGLKRNCRNTRNIAEHTATIAGFETPPFKPGAESGIDVDYRYWGTFVRCTSTRESGRSSNCGAATCWCVKVARSVAQHSGRKSSTAITHRPYIVCESEIPLEWSRVSYCISCGSLLGAGCSLT